ncbi:HAD family hydrolase [Flavobacterium cerinum]|uniref:HAD family hydrolase n=1 Tax=Flavobacterium cerinum TaxID=2502784 RepID=A0ABY5IPE4_9FLAO|nr:HAD family hydrolase [Flavobacterium cerinum]UUC44708.1 HAD family hydrolase [Flavobacterium cerinum]
MDWIPNFDHYKHISFDLWLTIIRSNPQFKNKRNELFRDYFKIDKPMEELTAVIRNMDLLTNTINEKVGKNLDTYEIYLLILGNLTDGKIERYTKKDLDGFYKETEELLFAYKPLLIHDTIPQVLETLHAKGIGMNILSNTAFIKGSSLRKILEHYEISRYFSFQLYSDEIGYSKPNQQLYQYAYDMILQTNDIKKSEIIHVGDNVVSDYDGALTFGFNAHLLKTNLNEPNLQPA